MDEGRFGRTSDLRACWAPEGVRSKMPREVVRESIYAFAAVAPRLGQLLFTLSARCKTAAMSLFLLAVWPEHHLLLFLDGAGWHKSRQLPLAEGLQLAFPPPYSPECDPTEHVWDEVREKASPTSCSLRFLRSKFSCKPTSICSPATHPAFAA